VPLIYSLGNADEVSGYLIYCNGELMERIPHEEATGQIILETCGGTLFVPGVVGAPVSYTLEVGAFDYGGNEARGSTTYTPGTVVPIS